ncbi:MAG: DUF3237 domain-containing protein [Ilumatobacteraceae bacterium]
MEDVPDEFVAPTLEPLIQLDVFVEPAIDVGTGPNGTRKLIPITDGAVRGAFTGRVLPGGADFQLIRPDGVAEIEARYVIETDRGELVYVTNTGVRHAPADVMARLAAGEIVDPAAVYFRTLPRFETASERLQWLTRDVFVATGARLPDRVRLAFYRVS